MVTTCNAVRFLSGNMLRLHQPETEEGGYGEVVLWGTSQTAHRCTATGTATVAGVQIADTDDR